MHVTRGISLIFAPMFASGVAIQDDGFMYALGILLKYVARFACPIVLLWQSQDITDESVTTIAVGVTFSFQSTRKKITVNLIGHVNSRHFHQCRLTLILISIYSFSDSKNYRKR